MQSLMLEALVAQDRTTGRYDLGPAALHIGIGPLRRIEPVEVAARLMKSLAACIAASCGVAIWTERGPTIVRWYRSSDFMVSTVSLGDVLPLDNTATGLVFQAFLPAERIEAARRMQPSSFRGKPPGADVLEAVRREGGADLREHLFSLLTGKAAPVFDAQNEIACVVTTVSFIDAAQAQDHRAAPSIAEPRVCARIRQHNSSNSIPSARAAFGTSEWLVMPGAVLTSSSQSRPSPSRIRSTRPQPLQPSV